jgi:hypothetical protein
MSVILRDKYFIKQFRPIDYAIFGKAFYSIGGNFNAIFAAFYQQKHVLGDGQRSVVYYLI